MATPGEREVLDAGGRQVTVTNPGKVYFPEAGITKIEVVRYYLAVAEGALRGAGGRPNVLVRYANGIHGEFFYQKRAPEKRPDWVEVVALSFPSGRTAEEVVPRDAAALAWMANLGCLELHPHPIRADDLAHPDELRVDLDPMPGIEWTQIQAVARVVQQALADVGRLRKRLSMPNEKEEESNVEPESAHRDPGTARQADRRAPDRPYPEDLAPGRAKGPGQSVGRPAEAPARGASRAVPQEDPGAPHLVRGQPGPGP